MKSALRALLVLILLLSSCSRSTGPQKEWKSFVAELTDLSRISDLSGPCTRLLSSYDRQGGNNDYNYFQQVKADGWVVLADLKGPGCVRRFWTTGIDPGHRFRLYFDGESKPRLQGTIDELFGERSPFTPPLARQLNFCWYSYIPWTFQKSLRIETQYPPTNPIWGPRRLYFQINYESLPPETRVETFPRTFSAADLEALRAASEAWRKSVTWPTAPSTSTPSTVISSHGTQTVFEAQGPGTLKQWHLQVMPQEPDLWTRREKNWLLQDTVLRIYYDHAPSPSVEVPLGDFFCNGWRKRCFGGLCLGSDENGYRCNLPIPFREHLRITLVNDADRPVLASFHPLLSPERRPSDGYLHAAWHRSGPDRSQPHRLCDFTGRGKLVGTFLGVTGLDDSWWILEGDEMGTVDGESSPSWHGTGLEDYFNGGWYYSGSAFAALHGILDFAPLRVAQFRFHLVDPQCFSQSLHLEIERGDQNVSHGFMRSVGYAYLAEPAPAAPCPADRNLRRAEDNRYDRPTLMMQLIQLERINDFAAARDQVLEYLEQSPEAPEAGVLRLRALEYGRLLKENLTTNDFTPFRQGQFGPDAQQQAELLNWFYEKPNRALAGILSNGRGKLYLDGQPILVGDNPLQLFVAGVELTEGPHWLAAEVLYNRMMNTGWLCAGLRTHQGMAGTLPGIAVTLKPEANWNTSAAISPSWKINTPRDFGRAPELPAVNLIPNAFVLLSSKVFYTGAPDWMAYKGIAYSKMPFVCPLPSASSTMFDLTGLEE